MTAKEIEKHVENVLPYGHDTDLMKELYDKCDDWYYPTGNECKLATDMCAANILDIKIIHVWAETKFRGEKKYYRKAEYND